MKILYYNWIDYLDDENRGGGVSVYQRNVMQAFDGAADAQAVFLSAGISYDLVRKAPRWEQVRHGPDADRAHRYEIVNSGIFAPAHHAFGDPAQLSHDATCDVVFDFIKKTGPYDVIHFNNLEGLPVDVLALKARFPGTQVYLTLHNYYPFCPQVNLWYNGERACRDFRGGTRCPGCIPSPPDARLLRMANAIAYHIKCWGIRPGTRAFDIWFRQSMRIGGRSVRALGWLRRKMFRPDPVPALVDPDANAFAFRRSYMVERINLGCDRVLCVSDRVRQIAQAYGLSKDLLQTCYIGTREADKFHNTRPTLRIPRKDGALKIAYLGYMRRDKGFFFLLDALEEMPAGLATQIHLLIAAKRGDRETMARLERLGQRLGNLIHIDGYSHDDLDDMLGDVDLGLVPALWEDNLPQVAIEMHARHIPLLASHMGGARELSGCSDMVFRAGDIGDFCNRIERILSQKVDWAAYWRTARNPQSTREHYDELLCLYREGRIPGKERYA